MTLSAKQVIEEKVAKRIREHPEKMRGIGSAVALELLGEGGGRWVIDCTKEPATIASDPVVPAATTISMEASVFEQMVGGKLDPQMAFLSGKIKVKGNLGAAIKLGQLLT